MKKFKVIFHHKNTKTINYAYLVGGNSIEEAINNICSCGCYNHNIRENLVSVEEIKECE